MRTSSHGKDANRLADVMAQEGNRGGIQPGLGRELGRVNTFFDLTRQKLNYYGEVCHYLPSL